MKDFKKRLINNLIPVIPKGLFLYLLFSILLSSVVPILLIVFDDTPWLSSICAIIYSWVAGAIIRTIFEKE